MKDYESIGVPEVWIWQDRAFRLHAFSGASYVAIARSGLVPALDFEAMTRFVEREDQHQAVLEWKRLVEAQPA